MPATNFNAATLGRIVVDMSSFGDDVPESIYYAFERLHQTLVGAGWPSPAEKGDTTYGLVYTRNIAGTDVLYSGNPSDPTNPTALTVTASGAGEIIIEWEGSEIEPLCNAIDFTGNVTVTADGSNHVTVDIGGDSMINSFETINIDGGTPAVADSSTDTLNLVSGNMIDITLSAADQITFAVDLSEHASYAVSENMLLGHVDDSATVAEWKTISDWLKLLPSYSAVQNQYLNNDNGTIQWKNAVAC